MVGFHLGTLRAKSATGRWDQRNPITHRAHAHPGTQSTMDMQMLSTVKLSREWHGMWVRERLKDKASKDEQFYNWLMNVEKSTLAKIVWTGKTSNRKKMEKTWWVGWIPNRSWHVLTFCKISATSSQKKHKQTQLNLGMAGESFLAKNDVALGHRRCFAGNGNLMQYFEASLCRTT